MEREKFIIAKIIFKLMNPFNHFLLSFNVLFIFFSKTAELKEILLFSLVFGVLVDFDGMVKAWKRRSNNRFGIKAWKKADKGDLRSWLHEPFGFILIGMPAALVFAFFMKPYYFFLAIIPYALHIIMDYLTIHDGVSPLAPFSKKRIKIGFIKPMPAPPWFKSNNGFRENYILIFNILVTIFLLLFYL